MIEASQRMITINSQGEELGGINPAIKRHLELQIKTLQTVPRIAVERRHWLGSRLGVFEKLCSLSIAAAL